MKKTLAELSLVVGMIIPPWVIFLLASPNWGWGGGLMLSFCLGPTLILLALSASGNEWAPLYDDEGEPSPRVLFVGGLSTMVAAFSWIYWVLGATTNAFDPGPLSRVDAVYFTLATLTTTGFGDLSATSPAARLVVSIQMALGILVIGVGVSRAAKGVQAQSYRLGPTPSLGDPSGARPDVQASWPLGSSWAVDEHGDVDPLRVMPVESEQEDIP